MFDTSITLYHHVRNSMGTTIKFISFFHIFFYGVLTNGASSGFSCFSWQRYATEARLSGRVHSPDCRFDYLEVRDGQYGYSNLLGNFCGTNFPPEITSKTRYLWLRFHSDENIEGKGFKAVWNTIPRPTYRKFPSQIFEFFFLNFLIFFSKPIFIKM